MRKGSKNYHSTYISDLQMEESKDAINVGRQGNDYLPFMNKVRKYIHSKRRRHPSSLHRVSVTIIFRKPTNLYWQQKLPGGALNTKQSRYLTQSLLYHGKRSKRCKDRWNHIPNSEVDNDMSHCNSLLKFGSSSSTNVQYRCRPQTTHSTRLSKRQPR